MGHTIQAMGGGEKNLYLGQKGKKGGIGKGKTIT